MYSQSVDPRSVMQFTESDSSVDLDDSFKSLLEKRRKECEEAKQAKTPVSTKIMEPGERFYRKTPLVGRLDETSESSAFEADKSEFMDSEDTFIRLEEMCQDNQEEAALKRLLKSSEPNSSVQPPNISDLTQLNDIEAPSAMWDQSIFHANSPKPSPLKMVHLLRPSTIIEESSNFSSMSKSNESTSAINDSLAKSRDMEQPNDVDQDSLEANSKDLNGTVQKKTEEDAVVDTVIIDNLQNTSLPCSEHASVVTIELDSSDEDSKHSKKETLSDTNSFSAEDPNFKPTIMNDSFNPSSKTIDSTTYESFATEKYSADSTNYTYYTAESTLRSSVAPKLVVDTNIFPKKKHTFFDDDIISISSSSSNLSHSVNKNETSGVDSKVVDENSHSSTSCTFLDVPKFNDTLEEMEYMISEGMKMAEKIPIKETEPKSKIMVPKQRNSPATPRPKIHSPLRMANHNIKSPLFGLKTNTDSASKKLTPNTFKKPSTSARPLSAKSKKFDHIISPIHQYIKNAPQYPLQAKGHGPTSGLIDELGNRKTRETQYFANENISNAGSTKTYEPVIPCKGAIAAPKIRLIDERTPTKIPGMGDRVTKLIGSTNPEVIKHEGRFKSADVHREINADNTIDESLQNLSMVSGDVSFQVIKDLKRF